MKYPLVEPSWGIGERQAIVDVMDSGNLTMGEKVKEFETAYASYAGSKYAVMVNSGSSANLIAMAAFRYHPERPIHDADQAIVPAISWSTTYSPLQNLHLKVVDVELDSLNMNVNELGSAMRVNTKLIVGVNILGNPARLDKMREFADENSLWFLEDNCESMGASLNGKKTGTFGHIGTHSMFFSHQMNTVEGGIILTDDEVLYDLCRSLREHGWDRCKKPDGGFYNFIVPGFNVRPTEMAAAVGLIQLNKLEKNIEQRRANAAEFQRLFGSDDRFIIQREHGKSSWFAFTMIVRQNGDEYRRSYARSHYAKKMTAADIGYRSICGGCFTEHPYISHFKHTKHGILPHARLAHYEGFFVGNPARNITDELRHLKETL